jgi:hypothetical protein
MSGILAAVRQRPFLNEALINEFVRNRWADRGDSLYSRSVDVESAARPDNMRARLILNTEKARTWLVVDPLRVDRVLDDRRREKPRLRLTKKLKDALPVRAGKDYSEATGVLTFGDMTQKWGYSKELFAPNPLRR